MLNTSVLGYQAVNVLSCAFFLSSVKIAVSFHISTIDDWNEWGEWQKSKQKWISQFSRRYIQLVGLSTVNSRASVSNERAHTNYQRINKVIQMKLNPLCLCAVCCCCCCCCCRAVAVFHQCVIRGVYGIRVVRNFELILFLFLRSRSCSTSFCSYCSFLRVPFFSVILFYFISFFLVVAWWIVLYAMCVFLVQSFIHSIFFVLYPVIPPPMFFCCCHYATAIATASGCWLLLFEYFFCSIRVLYCAFAVPNFRHETHTRNDNWTKN